MRMTERQTKVALLERIEESDAIAKKCVTLIDGFQTVDEQMERQTHYRNGTGFSIFDAEFGGSLADQIKCGKNLSDKQMFHVRRLARKYSGQVARAMNKQGAGSKDV